MVVVLLMLATVADSAGLALAAVLIDPVRALRAE